MGSLLVITGPPGAGKSAVAQEISGLLEKSVVVAGDGFFSFVRGLIPPWLPEANTQNQVVIDAAASAAGQFVRGGYEVIYDGVVGPWFLERFVGAAGLDSIGYAVLLPPLEVCLERVATRVGHGFDSETATIHMHDDFVTADIGERHVFSEPESTVGESAVALIERWRRGALTYPEV